MKEERRRHIRVPGPFSGWLGDSPTNRVHILDLSEGGCFVQGPGAPPLLSKPLLVNIVLANGATLRLTGEALYTRGEGYVILFSGLSQQVYAELEREVNRLRENSR